MFLPAMIMAVHEASSVNVRQPLVRNAMRGALHPHRHTQFPHTAAQPPSAYAGDSKKRHIVFLKKWNYTFDKRDVEFFLFL
jgi:hypothetical protein